MNLIEARTTMTLSIPYTKHKVDIPDLDLSKLDIPDRLKDIHIPMLYRRRDPWKKWRWIASGSVALLGLTIGGLMVYRQYFKQDDDTEASSSSSTSGNTSTTSISTSNDTHTIGIHSDTVAPAHATNPYVTWTKAELYEKAQAEDIEGRSNMSREELIQALNGS